MTDIERLRGVLADRIPGASIQLDSPENPAGEWWLDITCEGHSASIVWSPARGFGVTASALPVGYGEGPEETYPSLEETADRVAKILEAGG